MKKQIKLAANNKKAYTVEPVALIFNEDNYYMMAYSSRHPDNTASYRIDRMDHVELLEDSTLSKEAIAYIDKASDFTEQAFKMFGGKTEEVVLQFSKELNGPFFDKFGENSPISTLNKNTCIAQVNVQISPTFFGWLAQFGDKMTLVSPAGIREQYRQHIASIN